MTETITGTDRSAGTSFTGLRDADSHPVSDLLPAESRVGRRPRGRDPRQPVNEADLG